MSADLGPSPEELANLEIAEAIREGSKLIREGLDALTKAIADGSNTFINTRGEEYTVTSLADVLAVIVSRMTLLAGNRDAR